MCHETKLTKESYIAKPMYDNLLEFPKRPILVDLIRTVLDIGFKIGFQVLAHDITHVIDQQIRFESRLEIAQ